MADREGSVAVGWVAQGVLYARFAGGLSADLGVKFATRLQAFVEEVPSLRYFADAGALKHYDLLARSAFVRVVLANRRKFAAIVLLTWAEGISPTSTAFASVIGEPIDIVTNQIEFETRLLRVAPLARQKVD